MEGTGLDFRGRKVTVVGLGREGLALVRFLVARGAEVTVSDAQDAEALAPRLREIAGLPVRLALGGNRAEDLVGADLVAVSPGVPLTLPALAAARAAGVPLTNLTDIFLQLCRAPVIGVTGSNGKTTTTTLIGEMLRAAGRAVWVGGNIGRPLLEEVEEIAPSETVVLEMSSFQLDLVRRSPHIAVVTNISPNHLDMHLTFEAYVEAKSHILAHQSAQDIAVLGRESAPAWGLAERTPGRVLAFSRLRELEGEGAFVRAGQIVVRWEGREVPIMPVTDIPLPGQHNVENVLAACAVATVCGVAPEAQARAVRAFRGVEHRLEPVRTLDGVTYINDSIATSPERALMGLRSFERPIVLLAGGRDKHLPLEEWAAEARARCRAVVLFGEAAGSFGRALEEAPGGGTLTLRKAPRLAQAVAAARELAQPGDIVLFSPGGTSFDEFRDYEERGRRFKELVAALDGGP